jgi:hypothetical protein
MLPVIHRSKKIRAQQLRELACVDAVTLTAFFQKSIPTGIAHHQIGDVRLQQVIQPSRPRAFFKSDPQASTEPLEKLQNGAGFGFDDAFHHQLAGRI